MFLKYLEIPARFQASAAPSEPPPAEPPQNAEAVVIGKSCGMMMDDDGEWWMNVNECERWWWYGDGMVMHVNDDQWMAVQCCSWFYSDPPLPLPIGIWFYSTLRYTKVKNVFWFICSFGENIQGVWWYVMVYEWCFLVFLDSIAPTCPYSHDSKRCKSIKKHSRTWWTFACSNPLLKHTKTCSFVKFVGSGKGTPHIPPLDRCLGFPILLDSDFIAKKVLGP